MPHQDTASRKVEYLLAKAEKTGPLSLPIDLTKLAELCGVLSIERRPMVPEGVIKAVKGGFRVYLQSNFAHEYGMNLRERFTLAHELAHTLFYETSGEKPKAIRPFPKKEKLEYLCHQAASQILVPNQILRRYLAKQGEVTSIQSLLELEKLFEVSSEVLMRRLQQLGLIEDEKFAAILVGQTNSKSLIRAACYGSRLTTVVPRPERGTDFDTWVLPLLPAAWNSGDTEWTHQIKNTTVRAKKVFRSPSSFFLELCFAPST